ncbi:MAG: hypothetical protein NVSMB62_25630 [Acidobacteriaceae bacterium]
MKSTSVYRFVCMLSLGVSTAVAQGDASPASATQADTQVLRLERRVEALSSALVAAEQGLADSQAQLLELQRELHDLRAELKQTAEAPAAAPDSSSIAKAAEPVPAVTLEERQQALEAAVKTHEQEKVGSHSRYPVRLTGLVLFNGFYNSGVPDNIDLPALAQRHTSTSGSGSLGGGFRQTILGIEGDGPKIGGAHTSASLDFDFFSGVSYSSYGTAAGIVRLRTASINFEWPNESLSIGMSAPLISPLSPTSFATVAEPAMAGAGNLWTWAPQLRFAIKGPALKGGQMQLELGLWDSAAAGYSSTQFFRTASPGETSRQPAYETRISYVHPGGLQLGARGYFSRQAYPGYAGTYRTEELDSWAGAFDFRLPLFRFELTGEGYRGRSLGGLGGGVYKDAIVGTDPVTGLTTLRGLNAVGGWTQFKTRLSSSLETNVSIGLDDGMARDFHAVVLSSSASSTQLRARNRMMFANLIFRPKTYIILSPEYRKIWTWPIAGPANTVDVLTFSVGYQF